jgi:hypothetical protein
MKLKYIRFAIEYNVLPDQNIKSQPTLCPEVVLYGPTAMSRSKFVSAKGVMKNDYYMLINVF